MKTFYPVQFMRIFTFNRTIFPGNFTELASLWYRVYKSAANAHIIMIIYALYLLCVWRVTAPTHTHTHTYNHCFEWNVYLYVIINVETCVFGNTIIPESPKRYGFVLCQLQCALETNHLQTYFQYTSSSFIIQKRFVRYTRENNVLRCIDFACAIKLIPQ